VRISYDGKVAVVVGATSGIGRATAVAFAEAGAKVVVAGRREPEGAEVLREIEAGGGKAAFVRTDVTSEEQVAALMDAAVETYGGLDCAFNNAGREVNMGVADATVDEFEAQVDTNTRGVLLCLKHEIRVMRERGGGAIVNNSSVSGLVPTAAQAVYGLSKAAVSHLTRSAAAEVGKQGIRVNEIAPALLMSDMVKQYFEGPNAIPIEPVVAKLALDHVGQPEDGAAAVLFLCSEQANYITGVVLPVDGGFLLHNAGSA
jgi:NAD(P)-dependent dehydrogenase (short-subunit alcohol dehydrogenase family)